jgi:hypothetical protein
MRGASNPFTPSASRVTNPHLWHRRSAPFGIVEKGRLFLRNNTHITRVASALSLNHHCTLHQTNRSRTWTEANHLAGRGMTLPKTIFPNSSPSSVRAVLPFKWAKLMTKPSQGEKRATELPRTAHADARQGKRRVLPFGNFIVVRGGRRGKKVHLRVAREISGH